MIAQYKKFVKVSIDKSNMHGVILDFPKQFRVGLEVAKNVKLRGRFDAVLVCGMGGSALPGDILRMWLKVYKIDLPLCIHRDYELPHWTNERHLIICISYSGNTEETLDAFDAARRKNLKIIAITSGGKLAELCKKYEIPLAKIPAGYQPRMALGFQFAALMKILVNCGVIKDNLEYILALENSLKPEALETRGKKLAKKLKGKIPVIYASDRLKSLARIWKIKFNENSKIPAFYNCFPELNHNEMTGFTNPQGKFQVIFLRDRTDHPQIQKRMKIMAEIIKGVETIDIEDKDILYKVFSTILLGDWVSYYLALEYGIDPTPVKLQEEFKKKLATLRQAQGK